MILDADLIATIRGRLDAELGPIPTGIDATLVDQGRQKLAVSIAAAAQYVRDNAVVNPGIAVATPSGPGATTGQGSLS